MRGLSARRAGPPGERGSIAAIVAITLVVTLGLLVLVVDGGSLFLTRRSVVGANDAAALAYAQTCALGQANPVTQADDLAAANRNVPDASAPTEYQAPRILSGSCSPGGGRVQVWYQAPAPLQFARIFGFGSTSTVRGTAIAAWGGAGSAGSNLLPFMLDWGRLSSCYNFTFPPGPPAGTTCSFWFDATTSGSGNNQTYGVSNGDWGTVDLSDWNCSPNTSTCTPPCSTNDSTLRAWISGSGVPSVGLNYPSPTFVCAGQGATHNVFAGNCSQGSLQCQTGKQFAFPVNDDCTPGAYDPNLTPPNQGQADRNFNMCPAPGTSIQYYDIVGFAWLMIGAPGCTPTTAGQCAVISGKDVGSLTKNPGHYCVNDPFYLTDPSPSNGWCLVTTFEQYSTSTGGNPGGGHSFNEDTVALTG